MNREHKIVLLLVIAYLCFLPLLIPLTRLSTVGYSQFVSKMTNQNFYCFVIGRSRAGGCFPVSEKVTWSNYNKMKDEYDPFSKNTEATKILAVITWIWLTPFAVIGGVMLKRKLDKSRQK